MSQSNIIATDRTLEDSGKAINRYTFECNAIGMVEHYFLCLTVIDAVKNKGWQPYFTGCKKAIDAGNCQAVKMRAEELEKNQVIYFAESFDPEMTERSRQLRPALQRHDPVDYLSESYQRGYHGSRLARPATPQQRTVSAPVKPKAEPKSAPQDFSTALQSIIHDEVAQLQKDAAKPSVEPEKAVEQKEVSIQRLPGESPLEFAKRRRALLS